jgi:hypothetical protein
MGRQPFPFPQQPDLLLQPVEPAHDAIAHPQDDGNKDDKKKNKDDFHVVN